MIFHWYVDGNYVATTSANTYSLALEDEERVRISVIDTNDPTFDPVLGAPEGFPARRTLRWVRSADFSADYYEVEQLRVGDPAWTVIARVQFDARKWSYTLRTAVLQDLSQYLWIVYGYNAEGNKGDGEAAGTETVVRTPDAPRFTLSLDEGTGKVTFAEAA